VRRKFKSQNATLDAVPARDFRNADAILRRLVDNSVFVRLAEP
jgi:hypothetical protein